MKEWPLPAYAMPHLTRPSVASHSRANTAHVPPSQRACSIPSLSQRAVAGLLCTDATGAAECVLAAHGTELQVPIRSGVGDIRHAALHGGAQCALRRRRLLRRTPAADLAFPIASVPVSPSHALQADARIAGSRGSTAVTPAQASRRTARRWRAQAYATASNPTSTPSTARRRRRRSSCLRARSPCCCSDAPTSLPRRRPSRLPSSRSCDKRRPAPSRMSSRVRCAVCACSSHQCCWRHFVHLCLVSCRMPHAT